MSIFIEHATEDFTIAKSRVIQAQKARQTFLDAGGDRDSKEHEDLCDLVQHVSLKFLQAKAVLETFIRGEAAELDLD